MEVEEYIEDLLMHYADPNYDPAKAREYYLRTRKLKGRKKGAGEELSSTKPRSSSAPERHVIRRDKGMSDAEKRREAYKAKVDELQRKLERLKEVLKQLVDEAKRRAGDEPNKKEDKKTPAEKQAEEKDKDPKTAKEKREDAKRAKERREKEESVGKVKKLEGEISDVQEKITKARETLQKAIEDARERASKSGQQTADKAVDNKTGRRQSK